MTSMSSLVAQLPKQSDMPASTPAVPILVIHRFMPTTSRALEHLPRTLPSLASAAYRRQFRGHPLPTSSAQATRSAPVAPLSGPGESLVAHRDLFVTRYIAAGVGAPAPKAIPRCTMGLCSHICVTPEPFNQLGSPSTLADHQLRWTETRPCQCPLQTRISSGFPAVSCHTK